VVYRFSPAGVLLGTYPSGANPHGLSVDFDGNIWEVHHSEPHANKYLLSNPSSPIGYTIGAPPGYDYDVYLYSDFTGTQIHRQAPYTYVGSWSAVYDGQGQGIPWDRVAWNDEPQGQVPAETALGVTVRAADTLGALGTAAYSQADNGVPLSGVVGRYVQVRAALDGPGYLTPVLSDITMYGPCDPLGESCCVKDADCDDGNACTTDSCPTPAGACAHEPVSDCCIDDDDCDDGNACTMDTCPVAGEACNFTTMVDCCNSNLDCADGDLCTVDLCSGPGGSCSNPVIPGCCNTDLDCTGGDPCSAATCPVPGGFCVGGMIPDCCTEDADCVDSDLCTVDECDVDNLTCTNTPVPECCNLDAECDDGNLCTVDTCSGEGGVCQHVSVPGCCTDDDPSIGEPCDPPVPPWDHPPCAPGELICVDNEFVCEGAVHPQPEECNWIDDNCDGVPDSPAPCPVGTLCINGVCAEPCQGELGGCPDGYQCVGEMCLPTGCEEVICPPGEVCVGGLCVGADAGVGGMGGGGGSGPDAGGTAGSAGATSTGGQAGAAGGGLTPSGPDAGAQGESWGLSSGGGGILCSVPPGRRAPWGVAGLCGVLALVAASGARRVRAPRRRAAAAPPRRSRAA